MMQTGRFSGLLAMGLAGWMLLGAPDALSAGEAPAQPAWTPDLLASTTNLPLGQTLTVTGRVARIEKDGLSPSAFFVVLEGEVFCRMFWSNPDLARRNLRLSTEVGGRVVPRWNKRVMFAPGDRVVMRGLCRREMHRVVLDQAVQTEQFKAATTGLPWGR